MNSIFATLRSGLPLLLSQFDGTLTLLSLGSAGPAGG